MRLSRGAQNQSIKLFEQQLALETKWQGTRNKSAKLQSLLADHSRQYQASMNLDREDSEEDLFASDFLLDLRKSQRRFSDITRKELEEMERRRNEERPSERRCSDHTVKVNAWHQYQVIKQAMVIAHMTPAKEWMSSIKQCDPRYQIMKFFDEVSIAQISFVLAVVFANEQTAHFSYQTFLYALRLQGKGVMYTWMNTRQLANWQLCLAKLLCLQSGGLRALRRLGT
jgi:hypothetical protein